MIDVCEEQAEIQIVSHWKSFSCHISLSISWYVVLGYDLPEAMLILTLCYRMASDTVHKSYRFLCCCRN